MPDLGGFGKLLMLFGGVLVVAGLLITLAGKLPGSGGLGWFGRLPGDIFIKRDNVTFFFPITTSIVISIVLSLLLLLMTRR
ncbi:MAG: DUF2905 domain-containing protein [Nitrospirales bacterium]